MIRTLPGSGNDALKSLQSLPGASRVPFGLGGLVLRGFAPRDTNVFLDGIEVPILYHFGGLASFFPSTMIESMELVSSGYGPRYGRGQGGLVDIRSRPGRTDRWTIGSEVSLLDASVRAEGPAAVATCRWASGAASSTPCLPPRRPAISRSHRATSTRSYAGSRGPASSPRSCLAPTTGSTWDVEQ